MSGFVPIDFEGHPLTRSEAVSGKSYPAQLQPEEHSMASLRSHTSTPCMLAGAATPEDVLPHVQAQLRDITSRLEGLERGRDPFGDVNEKLQWMERTNQQLCAKLNGQYEHTVLQQRHIAQVLSSWHDQIKTEVRKHCEGWNQNSHEPGSQLTSRVQALEQSDRNSALDALTKRIDTLQTSRDGQDSSTRLHAITTLVRTLEKRTERIDSTCQQRHKDSQQGSEQFNARIRQLEQASATSTVGAAADQRLSEIEGKLLRYEREVQSHVSCEAEAQVSKERLAGMQKAVDQLSERQKAFDREMGKAQHNVERALADAINRIKPLEQAEQSRSHGSSSATTVNTQTPTSSINLDHSYETADSKIDSLARRVEEYNKATHKRFDFLVKQSNGQPEQDSTGLRRILGSTTLQTMASESDEAEASAKSTRYEVLKNTLAATNKKVGDLEARTAKVEQDHRAPDDPSAISDVRDRIATIEQSSLNAALDRRFSESAQRIEDIAKKVENEDGKGTFQQLQTDFQGLQEKLDAYSSQVTGEKAALADRVSKVEACASEEALKNKFDLHKSRQDEAVSHVSTRVGILEGELKTARLDTRKVGEIANERLSMLEKDSIAAAVDRRFETMTEQLAKLRQQVAADESKEQLAAVSSRLSKLEEDLRKLTTAHEVSGQVIDDVGTTVQRLTGKVEKEEASRMILTQDLAGLRSEQENLKGRATKTGENLELTREWLQRVSEKSQQDDRDITSEVQTHENEQKTRLEAVKDSLRTLQDDVRTLQSARRTESRAEETDLAEQILAFRRRLVDLRPSDEEKWQLDELLTTLFDVTRRSAHKYASDAKRVADVADNVPASTTAVGVILARSQQSTLSRAAPEPASAPSTSKLLQRIEGDDLPLSAPSVAKRQRIGEHGNRAASKPTTAAEIRQTETPESEESEEEANTPRRSDRKNRGGNERYESIRGMLTGDDWAKSMMRKRKRG